LEREPNSKSLFFEFKSPLVKFSLSFILGLVLSLNGFPVFLWFLTAFYLMLIAYQDTKASSRRKNKDYSINLVVSIAICVFGVFLGGVYGEAYLSKVRQLKLTKHPISKPIQLVFKVVKVEPYYRGTWKVVAKTLDGERFYFVSREKFLPERECLGYFVKESVKKDLIGNFGSLKDVLLQKGLSAKLVPLFKKGFICNKDLELEDILTLKFLRARLFVFSEKLSPVARGVFQALVLGVPRSIPKAYLEKLRAQGLYHLLAISGLNLGVVFALFYFLAKLFLTRDRVLSCVRHFLSHFPLQILCMWLSLPGAYIVLALSGFTPSAKRAFFFLLLYVISRSLFRKTTALSVLFLAVLVLVVLEPNLVINFSFELSFVATLCLLLGDRAFHLWISPFLRTKSRLISKIAEGIFVSLVVSLVLMPMLFEIGGEIPLATPLNNVFAGVVWSFFFIPGALVSAFFALVLKPAGIFTAEALGKAFLLYLKVPFLRWTWIPVLPTVTFEGIFFLALLMALLVWKFKGPKAGLALFASAFLGFYLLSSKLYQRVNFVYLVVNKKRGTLFWITPPKAWLINSFLGYQHKIHFAEVLRSYWQVKLRYLGISKVYLLSTGERNLPCAEVIPARKVTYLETRGLTTALLKNFEVPSLPIPSEVLVILKSIKKRCELKKLKRIFDATKVFYPSHRNYGTYYVFPGNKGFKVCKELELEKSFWEKFLFPFRQVLTGYNKGKVCKYFPYHSYLSLASRGS